MSAAVLAHSLAATRALSPSLAPQRARSRRAGGGGGGGGRRATQQQTVRAAVQDDEFAIFRFTLGIPGFDDEDIPRVVGLIGASLLIANHLASKSPPEAQARTELVGALLSAACVATPAIGRRLMEKKGGVKGGTLDVSGGDQVFAFSSAVTDEAAKSDMAWATYALLTQTNAQGAILHRSGGGGGVLCARGSVRLLGTGLAAPGSPEKVIAELSKSVGAS
eukprot:CAMPEP_0197576934 /NCGR_PEP_ID=MMETSP1326-20131121/1751_1 /TAXON_ID=1155430 /ORGANISM="Genus nov. species nov., Strain RCC2288" /LENGTH=220 /DNA_ID=CAMNT_0043139917 /DNA_START=48 /DNA_END=707 /DNA_ORIENTATION=-